MKDSKNISKKSPKKRLEEYPLKKPGQISEV
jgi:hypothetical protein